MDTATLVNEQIIDGKKLVDRLRNVGLDVSVAFWALTTEDETWHLYIASRLVDEDGLAAAYRRFYGELTQSQVQWVSRSDIKLISTTSLIANEAVKYQDPTFATRFGGRMLGNMVIDEALIYPSS